MAENNYIFKDDKSENLEAIKRLQGEICLKFATAGHTDFDILHSLRENAINPMVDRKLQTFLIDEYINEITSKRYELFYLSNWSASSPTHESIHSGNIRSGTDLLTRLYKHATSDSDRNAKIVETMLDAINYSITKRYNAEDASLLKANLELMNENALRNIGLSIKR